MSDFIKTLSIFKNRRTDLAWPLKSLNDTNGFIRGLITVTEISRDLAKQSRLFESVEAVLEWMRTTLKAAYKSYKYYKPEVEMGKCLTRYAHVTYPNIMRRLQFQNIAKSARNGYTMFINLLSTILNGNGFASFDETDGLRIGSKVADMTNDLIESPAESPLESPLELPPNPYINPYEAYTPYYNNYYQPIYVESYGSNSIRRRRYDTGATVPMPNRGKKLNYRYKRQLEHNATYAGPRHYPQEIVENEINNIDPDANIELTNKTAEEEADELFNFEPKILASLGLDSKGIKKYSLLYCTREYTMAILRRFTDTVLLA